ncbi:MULTISPECIES: hypothetical protein [Streptomyces]|uniref:hypothetical protein n=1 Tax=Streptomyces TaxID=1883 RepID=UPI00332F99B0
MQQIRFPQNEFQSFEAPMCAEVEKGACQIARLIEEDLIVRGGPQDASLGSEVELAERHGVGRAVAREAVRILEVRGTARMVRGPSGPNSGFRVREVDHSRTANFLMGFVLFFGTTEPQLVEAEEAIQRVRYGLCDDIRNDADLVVEQVFVALDLFDDVLGAIRQMMSGNGAIPGNPTVLSAPEVLNCSRAGPITERILRECIAEQWAQGHRLGSEEDLCFRYGVDIVMRIFQLLSVEYGTRLSFRRRGSDTGSGGEPVAGDPYPKLARLPSGQNPQEDFRSQYHEPVVPSADLARQAAFRKK